MDAAELLAQFESLGDNCEFGLVQRRARLEPLGFFRLNFATNRNLIRALDTDFAEVREPDRLEITAAKNGELMASIRDYGFVYHTRKRVGEVPEAALHAQQAKAVAFLTRKLLDDLRAAEKIFVRKGNDSASAEAIASLLAALRRHGPVTLLWVVPQDGQHPPGRVEVLQAGLLKGYIDYFASYLDAPRFSPVWYDICAGAHALWQGQSPPGTAILLRGTPPAAPVRPTAPPARPTSLYQPVRLAELAGETTPPGGERPCAEVIEYLPSAQVHVPALLFGDTDLPRAGVTLHPPGQGAAAGDVRLPAQPAYLLRDAVVHGKFGMVTLGDRVVFETLAHLPLHLLPGGGWQGGALRLPQRDTAAVVHSAMHLLAGNVENYFHWINDAIGRYSPAAWELLREHPETAPTPILLVPQLDMFWKWESLGAAVPDRIPRVALEAGGHIGVQRLLFAPNLSGGGFTPHPALIALFDRMRINAIGQRPAGTKPWRKLFVARSDSRHRVLVNEAELVSRAELAGFTRFVPGEHGVGTQIRMFAEASHVIAPHGAGLTNIGFCAPGAVLCELHMDRYVHWAFRRLAALRGVRYGCLIGTAIAPLHETPHDDIWRLEPQALEAVLADPAFVGG